MRTTRSGWTGLGLTLVVAMLAGCGGSTVSDSGGGGTAGGSGLTCTMGGKKYSVGEKVVSSDGCQRCTCLATGELDCSNELCPGACVYGGEIYLNGSSFRDLDDCNTCYCNDGNVSCTFAFCAKDCEYYGQTYKPGQTFPAADGCNTCSCSPSGAIECTQLACPTGCSYGGADYPLGASFPALDGCNKCTCEATGVSCTELSCPCDPKQEWWRSYVATDPKTCADIDYACESNTTPFENQCGCGCEQDPSCPPTINCMPPADCSALVAKCPYSSVAY
ncbi:MAG: hypothetical protein R3B13_18805 [Polyangiaceae bacterium]